MMVEVQQVERLQDEFNDMQQSQQQDGTVTALREEKEEHETEIGACQEEIRKLEAALEKVEEEQEPFQKEKEEKEREQDSFDRGAEQLQSRLTRLVQQHAAAKKRHHEMKVKINSLAQELDESKKAVEEQEKKLEANTEKAAELGDRIDSRRSVDAIKGALEALKTKINNQKNRVGPESQVELEKKFKANLKIATETKAKFKDAETIHKMIAEGLNARKKKWHKLLTWASQMSNMRFNVGLTQKGHSGGLEFHHDNQHLTPKVSLNVASQEESNRTRTTSDMKSLSGGEKSFVTTSLLLSLWPMAESPFRVMDEFDVFMDEMYRKNTMRLLLEGVTREHQQSIFITPLSLAAIPDEYAPKVTQHTLQRPDKPVNR
eukprot:TRINITY_DN56132_c0_g3_i1.p1 TRINITY_DN56132_c0_g3~~TRINITY_DN56132_c0_g3_i1.p1  ORF type:complete len:426 (+),score=58.28 TRINITY_DN56132_c0_g3_i1:154-1278(+)